METMPTRDQIHHHRRLAGRSMVRLAGVLVLASAVILGFGCSKLREPVPEPFFSSTVPPRIQEFRWSNGKLPVSLDPARAAAPPETDIVRAVFEGLTETDPRTLDALPGVAETWTASEDLRVWTFKLRKDARWSDGSRVTAHDFERAWKRLAVLGEKAVHRNLLSNIVGMPKVGAVDATPSPSTTQTLALPDSGPASRVTGRFQNRTSPVAGPLPSGQETAEPEPGGNVGTPTPSPLPQAEPGFLAVDEMTFRVKLVSPDKDFPKVAAHPIFRPRHAADEEVSEGQLQHSIRTNGAFRIVEVSEKGIRIERSDTYWNRDEVRLERVSFVVMDTAEEALAAYRNGELDAITNTRFSSLTLKLLTPYDDFRTTTHSALNFYEVNTAKAPFSDRRVREALSNAVERERLTESDTDGITRPALGFLPFGGSSSAKLTQDKAKARELLDKAGFPDGEGFPTVRLLINRNDTQQRVARSVARMWKENLNIETEIIVRDLPEVEKARETGDFDLVRRGAVFPTSADAVNFRAIFSTGQLALGQPRTPDPVRPDISGENRVQPPAANSVETSNTGASRILTEDDYIYELRAIPLYFPTSFSLVKPYVSGFELNSLDAIVLANVSIDSNWAPVRN